jgi:hypothetical protein
MIAYEDTDGIHVIEEAEAITIALRTAENHGYTYANNQQALEDFMAVHWAWKLDAKD